MIAKDELIKQLQDQVAHWRNKYESLAKLYTQLRTEHLELLSKSKQFQLKANSAQEAVDRMERMERDIKAKNLELADMIRERDRARFDIDRTKSVSSFASPRILHTSHNLHQNHKDEIDRLKRELRFANERADDASRNKSSEVTGLLNKYNRQLNELEDSLRVGIKTYSMCIFLTGLPHKLLQSKQIQIDDLLRKIEESSGEVERLRDDKDQEIQILQESLDSTIQQMSDVQQVRHTAQLYYFTVSHDLL